MGAVKNPKKVYTCKKCYDCLKELTLDAKVCFSCGNKVGPVDKNGIAKRPIDWKAYAVAFLAGLGFCYYMWWAFFQ